VEAFSKTGANSVLAGITGGGKNTTSTSGASLLAESVHLNSDPVEFECTQQRAAVAP